ALTVHPGNAGATSSFFDHFGIPPDAHDRIGITGEFGGDGCSLRWRGPLDCAIPSGTMWAANEVRWWPTPVPVNEFGYLYAALYIAGNYARYYPDRWLLDVESSSPLALAMEHLTSTASERMALLTLSELDRTYYIPGPEFPSNP